jgi:hypothetical protein
MGCPAALLMCAVLMVQDDKSEPGVLDLRCGAY